MWKKMIERGVMDSSLESFSMWRALAAARLEEGARASKAARVAREHVDAAQPQTPEDWEALISNVDPEFRWGSGAGVRTSGSMEGVHGVVCSLSVRRLRRVDCGGWASQEDPPGWWTVVDGPPRRTPQAGGRWWMGLPATTCPPPVRVNLPTAALHHLPTGTPCEH